MRVAERQRDRRRERQKKRQIDKTKIRDRGSDIAVVGGRETD